jgi:outer membrane protein insertion porin family
VPRRLRWGLALMIVLLLTGFARAADTAEQPRIVVFPFQVNSTEDLTYLRTQIAEVLGRQLEKSGAIPVALTAEEMNAFPASAGAAVEQVDRLGAAYEADHLIWGSFTQIGDTFSIDANLKAAGDSTPARRFFIEGRNLENLLAVINDLSDQMALTLFRHESIADIKISGNQRIETDAILRQIKSQKSGLYKPSDISRDLQAVYKMGYFDDVRADSESTPQGRVITFQLKEKPTIRRVNVKGNSFIKEEKIRENLTIDTGAVLNIFKVRGNVEQIEALYKEKNYYNAKIGYEVIPVDNNQADLEFIIDEGRKLYVTEIHFEGNKELEEKELKKVLKTSEKGFFYFLSSSGDLRREVLDQDVARLASLYQNKGYINARVGEPAVDIQEEEIYITFKIEEGPRFKVGQVDIVGDLIHPREEMLASLSIDKEAYFNREQVRNDVLHLTDQYADLGYAYADVAPNTKQDPEKMVVDITYTIRKQQLVYFENIMISGNNRTRDKVIRRELKVQEQELYSNKDLKRSIRNLYRLEYFEDIKVDTVKGSADDKMILKLDVTEKPTGTFSFGVGYSSEENVFVLGSISKDNLFGRGQSIDFTGQIGSNTNLYTFTFTEPWLFDIPLMAKFKAYNEEKDYDAYIRNRIGTGLLFGYRIFDYTNVYLGYDFDITDIDVEDPNDTPDSVLDLEGENITSSANTSLVYDSRDRVFSASEGSKHSIFYEYAGLGGDIGYHKYIAQSQKYFPLFKGLIGFVNGKFGYVEPNDTGKILPDYEKFYLGGIDSLRGYGWHGVHLTEINSRGNEVEIGGDTMAQLNLELIFPVTPTAGVNGVVFYDTGNVYDGNVDFGDLKKTAGVGIRWLSPLAPIQLMYGWVLDKEEDDSSGRFEFSLGGNF